MTEKEWFEKVSVEEISTENLVTQPLVSVVVVAYNHKNYIEQCLDGILNQETNFKYEVLLGEDASNDGTREICVSYAEKHPDKIRVFLHHRENNIKVGGNPTGRFNFLYNLRMVRGEYIAYCEGDDYWTDKNKLQQQVDILQSDKKLSFCFSKSDVLFETDMRNHSYLHMDHYPKTITLEDYLEHYYPIPHLTKVWRAAFNPDFSLPEWKEMVHEVRFFDNALHFYQLIQGPAAFVPKITATYRVQGNSVTRQGPKDDAWHNREILLTHGHFLSMVGPKLRPKLEAIRSLHFEKLIHGDIARKNLLGLLKDIFVYMKDAKSGTILNKFKSIIKTFNKHM